MFNKEDAIKRILEVTSTGDAGSQDVTWRREVVRSCLEGYAESRIYILRAKLDEATSAVIQKALEGNQED